MKLDAHTHLQSRHQSGHPSAPPDGTENGSPESQSDAITSVSPNDAHHCATVSSIITPPLIAIDVTHWVGSAPSLVGSPMVIRWLLSVYFMAVEGSSWVV